MESSNRLTYWKLPVTGFSQIGYWDYMIVEFRENVPTGRTVTFYVNSISPFTAERRNIENVQSLNKTGLMTLITNFTQDQFDMLCHLARK